MLNISIKATQRHT